MADVKWIKITTNMFEDEKINFIESLPEADALLVIWIKLLTLAGKCNANGFICLTEKIPYTETMLAHKFQRPLSTVKLALETFSRLEMIEFDSNGFLRLVNWGKYQNIEGLDRIREQTRQRVARYRERQKKLLAKDSNVTSNATVTQSNETDIEKDKEINNMLQSKKQADEYTPGFEEFWANYPRKIEKRKAFRVWKTRIKEHPVIDLILAAKKYSVFCKKNGTERRFIKHPATFIGPDKHFLEFLEEEYDIESTANIPYVSVDEQIWGEDG